MSETLRDATTHWICEDCKLGTRWSGDGGCRTCAAIAQARVAGLREAAEIANSVMPKSLRRDSWVTDKEKISDIIRNRADQIERESKEKPTQEKNEGGER